ncbi:hypothetical protein RUM43_003888 [Polyplax serrata]|uniref:Uncharacterized protein n=1 Tax=Polyplax serrata TaxID=468196 RepID=A0AAN8P7B0_POLSC
MDTYGMFLQLSTKDVIFLSILATASSYYIYKPYIQKKRAERAEILKEDVSYVAEKPEKNSKGDIL